MGRGNADYVLRSAVAAIKQFKKMDTFIADAEKQLAKDPDSLSLNYQLALLHQEADDLNTAETRAAKHPTPLWLKLVRTGNGEIAGFSSPDGQDWKEIARVTVPLGAAPLAALAAVAPKSSGATLIADHLTLTPPPADVAGAAPGMSALPAPWVETLLSADDPPRDSVPSTWSDGTFTVHASGGDAGKPADGSCLVHRPFGEATELAAHVISLDGSSGNPPRGGIMLRAGLAPDAPYAALLVLPGGGLVFQHRDHAEQATAYWRKLAELQPKDATYQRLLARRLAQRGLRDEAVTVYNHLLDQSPDEGFSAANDLEAVYRGSRMIALVPRLLAWNPGTGNSPYGGRANYGFALFQAARECARQKQPDLVIALCRRAAALDATLNGGAPSMADLFRLLLTTLIEQHRRDRKPAMCSSPISCRPQGPARPPRTATPRNSVSVTLRRHSPTATATGSRASRGISTRSISTASNRSISPGRSACCRICKRRSQPAGRRTRISSPATIWIGS